MAFKIEGIKVVKITNRNTGAVIEEADFHDRLIEYVTNNREQFALTYEGDSYAAPNGDRVVPPSSNPNLTESQLKQLNKGALLEYALGIGVEGVSEEDTKDVILQAVLAKQSE